MTTLAGRIAASRVLWSHVIGATVIGSFQFCAALALADATHPGTQAISGKHLRADEKRTDDVGNRFISAHNQRGDERPPAPAPPGRGDAGNDKTIAVGPGIGATIGGTAPLVVQGSVKVVTMATPASLPTLVPEALTVAIHRELAAAFAGFTSDAGRIEIGTVSDGEPRLLFVRIGDENKQTFWRFAPPDQPEGWFDDAGRRLGGSVLAEPKPQSRISSQFGIRRYYGRISSGGFHNGIDYEGKMGEPIFAAADGVINHSGWYFEYGRTVKITHAERFETLYAHLSRFAEGIAPGSKVRKGELIGYVGMTGRSTGPHLHFSTIVNGQFVDPQPYISGNRDLRPDTLVLFRKWQEAVRAAAEAANTAPGRHRPRNLKADDGWTARI